MRSLQSWIDEYGLSHKNPKNKLIHWVCVPAIFFSIIGLLASIPAGFISENVPEFIAPYSHIGTVLILLGLLFYLRLSFTMFLGILLWCLFCLWGNTWIAINVNIPLWRISLGIFVIAWVGQFIGHNIEGAKPSFLKDVQFLLIGPAWLMAFIYKRLGIKY